MKKPSPTALVAASAAAATTATATTAAAPEKAPVTMEQLLDRAGKLAQQIQGQVGPGWFQLRKMTAAFQESPEAASDRLLALVRLGLAATEYRDGKVKFKILLSVAAQVSELQKHEAALKSELDKVRGKITLLRSSAPAPHVVAAAAETR